MVLAYADAANGKHPCNHREGETTYLDTYTDVFAKLHAESTEKFDDLIAKLNESLQ